MNIAELRTQLTDVNTEIERAYHQQHHDTLSTLADQQHTLVADIFAQLAGEMPDEPTLKLLHKTVQLNNVVNQQFDLQKKQLFAEQFDLKRRAQATLHYVETEQL